VTRIIAESQVDQQLALALVESDRRYFEMAARTQRLAIGQLCWMPGLHELAASCVVHRIASDRIPNPMESWLDDIEAILSAHSISRARIYLDDSTPEIEDIFQRSGYETRCELGFLSPEGETQPPRNIQLRQVLSSTRRRYGGTRWLYQPGRTLG